MNTASSASNNVAVNSVTSAGLVVTHHNHLHGHHSLLGTGANKLTTLSPSVVSSSSTSALGVFEDSSFRTISLVKSASHMHNNSAFNSAAHQSQPYYINNSSVVNGYAYFDSASVLSSTSSPFISSVKLKSNDNRVEINHSSASATTAIPVTAIKLDPGCTDQHTLMTDIISGDNYNNAMSNNTTLQIHAKTTHNDFPVLAETCTMTNGSTNETEDTKMGVGAELRSEKENQNQTESATVKEENTENELDIILNNVVCNFSVRCHLNLKQIAMTGNNVEFHKEMAMLIMKLRNPRCTASIWSSGKITMTGATTEDDAKVGARRCARVLQRLGFNVKFTNFRIVNVLATCTMPFAIKISDFAQAHPRIASYEPELHPGCTYKIKDIRATLKIFSTGSITITAPCVQNIQIAVEEAYRLVFDYRNERRYDDLEQFPIQERKKRRREERLLKEKHGNGSKLSKAKLKSQNQPPPRKKARLSRYDAEVGADEEPEEIEVEDEEEDEVEAIINLKTPIEEETEDEDEAGFDSDASHD